MKVDKFLSSADASRVLNITPAAIRLMARRGELRIAAMTEGGMQLFTRADVETLAQSRLAKSAQKSGSGEVNK
jgi:DNA-binding transcriptional MerR regulator